MPTLPQPSPVKTPIPAPVFAGGHDEFRRLYNRSCFQFHHRLSGHPLFELPRLATLAETLLREDGPGSVRRFSSDAAISMKWSEMRHKGLREEISQAIEDLEKSGSWLLLYRTQTDPEYRVLMEQIITEIGEMTGAPLAEQVTWKDAYIFMASPGSVTPYHIDHESTFLFQIRGQREANIWDRSVVTDPELEDYYRGNTAAANYNQENQSKANVYSMAAGTGVHHPCLAPHAFKNGPTYSIALGVHFCLRDWDRQARIHQINACLRRFRFQPTPPGRSAWRDRAKIGALGLLSKRNPKNKNELIRSGFMRLVSPLAVIPGLKRRLQR
jgi:hypothetical protein